MRHIPEEELHAYLDQALSRSQCVEIESHLDVCAACRAERDGIAALRDRTTALLATLAPPRRLGPAFEEIRRRQAARVHDRTGLLRNAAWAASLIAALGVGYAASAVRNDTPRRGPGTQTEAARPATQPAPSAPALAAAPESRDVPPAVDGARARTTAEQPAPRATPARPGEALAADTAATEPSAREPRASTVQSDPLPRRADALALSPADVPGVANVDTVLSSVWRTVSWERAQSESGETPARIDGLPVVEVQMRPGREGGKPIMVVAQQLASGEMIQTIEGPAGDVTQLLKRRGAPAPEPPPVFAANGAQRETMAMLRGDRILAITAPLPTDSLRAMIRRLNAELRTR